MPVSLPHSVAVIGLEVVFPAVIAVILQRKMGTTDFTDYTDFESVMSPCPFTQKGERPN